MDKMTEQNEKVCSKCNVKKCIDEFPKNKKSRGGYTNTCKLCRKNQHNKWVIKNPDYNKNYLLTNKNKRKEISKRYYEKNREEILLKREWGEKEKEYYNEYRKKRKLCDVIYKMRENVRSRIRQYIKQTTFIKKRHTFSMVGCSPYELKKYMEEKFIENMSWDNYGEWHIDHIIPLSSAKTEEDLYKLCHYTNLQPLWGKDNLEKSNKIYND